jgi:tetratricopeptide (TPR) repeat protein
MTVGSIHLSDKCAQANYLRPAQKTPAEDIDSPIMPEDPHPPPSNRHQIIHWDPGHSTEPEEPTATEGRRTIYLVAGGFALVILAVGATWGVFSVRAGSTTSQQGTNSFGSLGMDGSGTNNPRNTFVSRSRAELSRDTSARALAEFRRMPAEHPRLIQELILLEKGFLEGERLLDRSNYHPALLQFENVNQAIEDFSEQIELRVRAKEGYDNFLVRIEQLEIGRNLASASYIAAFSSASEGRQFLEQGSFKAATMKLYEAEEEMDKIEAKIDADVENQLLDGRQALASGDRQRAINAFQAVLNMDPDREEATRGLTRAGTIETLDDLLERAVYAEDNDEFEQSLALFEEAQTTDPLSAKAQQGVARLKKKIKDRDFDGAISAAEAAKKEEDWATVIAAYERALEVYPRRDEIQDLLTETRTFEHELAVQTELGTAYGYENDRKWMDARKAYLHTLEIEPKQEEAEEGLVRTSRMLRIILRFEKLLELAADQAARAEFQASIRSFNEAISIKPDYIELTESHLTLKNLLSAQSKPINIKFESDRKTWVTISNFKLLGKFDTEHIKILPGDYEIVGRRKGYKDVVLVLEVRAGSPPPHVKVVCDKRLTR